MSDEVIGPNIPQNRDTAASKLRRGKKHCPVCLAPLAKIAGRGRYRRSCLVCQAHISMTKCCLKCLTASLWENKQQAACQSCGLHGSKKDVIAPPEA